MIHRHLRRITLLSALVLLACSFGRPQVSPAAPASQAAGHRLFLPQIVGRPPRPTVFGIEMHKITAARGLDLAVTSGTGWIRRNGLQWKLVEPVEGAGYRWDAPEIVQLEQELRDAAQNGMNVILIVRGSPGWAVSPYTVDCAPINPTKQGRFASFLAAAVERYSRPPFNVKYWEIGNEPDAYVMPTDRVFGCWGIADDPYYGGEAYGRMLNVVAPAMRAANPAIRILNGGLLLDKQFSPSDPSSRVALFMDGVLRAGAGSSFDILSFHTYVYHGPGSAEPLGPRTDWRVSYLRDLLARYSIPSKPMIRTEAALLCYRVVTAECRWAQADFVGRLYARSLRDGLLSTVWYIYDNDSHHSTALIEPSEVFVPRPGYFAYRNAARIMGGAEYVGPLEGVPAAVEGYRLRKDGETVVVYWSDTPQPISVAVPPGASVRCVDRDGGEETCARGGGRVSAFASPSPQYILFR